jgi:F0F1-type ATP synthase assembly protein I
MKPEAPDAKDVGYYFALSQVGLEMVAPIGLGVIADQYLGTTPWITVAGAVLGLVGGMTHLIVLVNRKTGRNRRSPPRRDHS